MQKILVQFAAAAGLSALLFGLSSCYSLPKQSAAAPEFGAARGTEWRAIHMFAPTHAELPRFCRVVTEVFAPLGINVLIVEVNYSFAFGSHPELQQGDAPMTREDARILARICREQGIRLIPMFNCFGHQSWAETTFPLLTRYPEFDETPDIPKSNEGIYCRSWCPRHPDLHGIVFALLDELIEAFEADAFHVGMDEVFLIASEQCPRCRGGDPAEIFATEVNALHGHLVGKHKLLMLMWGDRLLDTKILPYSEWEGSANGTAPAIDRIPRDIIVCDWHYEHTDNLLSIPHLQEKGFRVIPATWNNAKQSLAFRDYALAHNRGGVIGHLCCTWIGAAEMNAIFLKQGDPEKWHKDGVGAEAALRAVMEKP